jgi:hypothetical protein
MTDTAPLREALAKMTPGPWHVGGPHPGVSVVVCVDGGCGGDTPEPPAYEPICILDNRTCGDVNPEPLADAAGIVLLRNSASGLLDEVDRLRAQLAESHGTCCENSHVEHADCTDACSCVGSGKSAVERLKTRVWELEDELAAAKAAPEGR